MTALTSRLILNVAGTSARFWGLVLALAALALTTGCGAGGPVGDP